MTTPAPAASITCATCNGTGQVHSHNPTCWDCDGRGWVPRTTKPIPSLRGVVIVVVRKPGLYLVSQRADTCKSFPGLLQFPGGTVEWGEDDSAAAIRELREETGLTAIPEALVALPPVHGTKPEGDYTCAVFLVDATGWEKAPQQMEPDKAGPWYWKADGAIRAVASSCLPGMIDCLDAVAAAVNNAVDEQLTTKWGIDSVTVTDGALVVICNILAGGHPVRTGTAEVLRFDLEAEDERDPLLPLQAALLQRIACILSGVPAGAELLQAVGIVGAEAEPPHRDGQASLRILIDQQFPHAENGSATLSFSPVPPATFKQTTARFALVQLMALAINTAVTSKVAADIPGELPSSVLDRWRKHIAELPQVDRTPAIPSGVAFVPYEGRMVLALHGELRPDIPLTLGTIEVSEQTIHDAFSQTPRTLTHIITDFIPAARALHYTIIDKAGENVPVEVIASAIGDAFRHAFHGGPRGEPLEGVSVSMHYTGEAKVVAPADAIRAAIAATPGLAEDMRLAMANIKGVTLPTPRKWTFNVNCHGEGDGWTYHVQGTPDPGILRAMQVMVSSPNPQDTVNHFLARFAPMKRETAEALAREFLAMTQGCFYAIPLNGDVVGPTVAGAAAQVLTAPLAEEGPSDAEKAAMLDCMTGGTASVVFGKSRDGYTSDHAYEWYKRRTTMGAALDALLTAGYVVTLPPRTAYTVAECWDAEAKTLRDGWQGLIQETSYTDGSYFMEVHAAGCDITARGVCREHALAKLRAEVIGHLSEGPV